MIRQGQIYLVNFAKTYHSEFGKIRPAVVIQDNFLNRALETSAFKGVVVIPLTTQLAGGDYRYFIPAQDKLHQDSEAVTNWVCTLDIARFDLQTGVITELSSPAFSELMAIFSRTFTIR
jgi:mRNA interferase MazF